MEQHVANLRVRNVGTLGGNLCFSDPHSDPATFLLAVGAEVEVDGARQPLAEFLVGPYETALEHGQLLHSVRIPLPAAGTRIAHKKLAFHERPAATVACAVRADAGTIAEARIAVGSVGPRAVLVEDLAGVAVDDADALATAAERAAEASGAVEDANGSAEYKQQLVRVLVERCVREALACLHRVKVWIDITAAAHVLVFRPLVKLLRERGAEVEITAREYGQTRELLELHGLEAEVVGHHAGRSRLAKAGQMASRLRALRRFAKGRDFDVASRTAHMS